MESRNLGFDNALRYLYDAIRYRGKPLMAITFEHNGKSWRADTVEEALKLRRRLEALDKAAWGSGVEPEKAPRWTPDLVVDLLEGLGDLQGAFLRVLFDNKQITSGKAVKQLGLDSEIAFAGVLSGLSKQLKKIGLKPWELYSVVVSWAGKEKTRMFQLSPDFRFVAMEVGWPDSWQKGVEHAASTKTRRK